jgi:hypothetical protein
MLPEPAQIPRVEALMKQWGVMISGSLYHGVTGMRRTVREIYQEIVMV